MLTKTKKRAFTILELVVVMATVAILFVVMSPRMDSATSKAKVASVQTDFRAFYTAVQHLATSVANPATLSEEEFENHLNSCLDTNAMFENKESVKSDPWGRKYRYDTSVMNNKFCVIFASQGDNEKYRFKTSDMGKAYALYDDESGLFVPRITLSFAIVDGDIFALTEEEHNAIENQIADIENPLSGTINDVTAVEGNPFTFTLMTRGDTTGVTYQWYRNGEELIGENGASITLTADNMYNDNKFMCQLTKNGKTYNTNIATLTVIPSTITNVAIRTMPVKTNYFEGQDFSSIGLTLEAIYSNGTAVLIDNYTISGGENLSQGTTSVTAVWGEYTIPVPINVVTKSQVGIKIAQLPSKTNYVETQDFNSTGLIVAIEYTNGSMEPLTEYTINGGTKLKPGTQKITVNAMGFSTSFNVNVTPLKVIKLEVTKQPTKTRYLVNTPFEIAGMEVKATWNNGMTKIVTNTSGTSSNGSGYTPVTNGYIITDGASLAEGKTSVTLKMDSATVSIPIEVYTHKHTGQPGLDHPNGCYTVPVETGGHCSGYQSKYTVHECSCGNTWPCPNSDGTEAHTETFRDEYTTKYHTSKGSCNEWVPTYTYEMGCGYPLNP